MSLRNKGRRNKINIKLSNVIVFGNVEVAIVSNQLL